MEHIVYKTSFGDIEGRPLRVVLNAGSDSEITLKMTYANAIKFADDIKKRAEYHMTEDGAEQRATERAQTLSLAVMRIVASPVGQKEMAA